MEGWITDAYADAEKGTVVLWIKGTSTRRFSFQYMQHLYVHGQHSDMAALQKEMEDRGYATSFAKRKAAHSMRELEMLDVCVPMASYRAVAEEIYAKGMHNRFLLFDVDMQPEHLFMLEHSIFPMAYVSVHGRHIECLDAQAEMDYAVPELRCVEMDAMGAGGRFHITVDGETVSGGIEAVMEAMAMVDRSDADVIITRGGDRFFHNLMATTRKHGLPFLFGREEGMATYSSRSYVSYGRTVYKPSPALLRGRMHIDVDNAFLYTESGMEGLCEISRLSYFPVQQLSRVSPGTAISSMETAEAFRRGIAVPWKKNRPEAFKRASELIEADRGGLIYNPRVGFFTDVHCLDFSSLYPSIMRKYNISVDVLNCSCCTGNTVPGLPYHFCTRRTGIVPAVVGMLISRRRKYKMHDEHRMRRNALKWVLVTSFGYTGYKNARFGSIECHEAINAHAREILLSATRMAEERGFAVLHGIVDSLWLQGSGDVEALAAEVERSTGIPFETDGTYRWIVFLSNKTNGAGSLNRYYGLLEDGTWKVRGIELRRSDTPSIVRYAQMLLLEHLRPASSTQDFMERAGEGLARVKELVRHMSSGQYPMEKMVITRRFSMEMEEYTGNNEQRRLSQLLKKKGMRVHAGEAVSYVLASGMHSEVPVQVLGNEEYSASGYRRLIARAMATMLLPFGYDEKRVLDYFRCS